ncbi:DUF1272 domain-containing protein [Streptomyces sp. NPDC052016]|uniref:DUF1272 domain-containing protein n=1 Tax=Streptomyces sp. NPDC052016 TaxID=3365680 RepID=UPI0037CD0342
MVLGPAEDGPTTRHAPALICSYECTFCPPCGEQMGSVCPNCGGELVARPRRAVPA